MSVPSGVLDEDRLAALDSYDILDTPPEKGFNDIVQVATLTCNVPVALVSLVAGDRQWFKARIGFPSSQTDLDSSVCAFALDEPDLLVIPDLIADPRTARNPLVTGDPHLRFYAGAPLRTPEGHVLGSVCVIDKAPRPSGLLPHQAEVLRILAAQVMALLELRRTVVDRDRVIARRREAERHLGQIAQRLQISEAHWRGLFERLREGFAIGELVRDPPGQVVDWRYLDVNPTWGRLLGIAPEAAIGRTIREVLPGVEEAWIDEFAQVVATGEPAVFTRQVGSLFRWYEGRAFPLDGDRFAVLFLEVTERIRADLRRNALLEIGDQLRDLHTVEDITRTASSIVGRALGATRVGFGRLDKAGEYVVIEPDWTAEGTPSIAGRHRFEDYGDIRKELMLGEPLVIRDVLTDSRTVADPSAMMDAQIRALVNIPVQEHGRTVAVFLAHDVRPRAWKPDTIDFLRSAADRLAAAVARLHAEEQQALLNGELSHRMKNMMAAVQAIANQTLKGVTERDAVESFQQRLLALSSAHDELLRKNWTTTPLRRLVEGVLSRLAVPSRFAAEGPDITLGPRATLSTSLLLHELATNAAKYGALSVDTGQITVAWHVESTTGELVFTWKELGGPPAVEPIRRGFGSRLIRSGLIGTGGVSLRYLASGLEAEMRASMEQVQAS